MKELSKRPDVEKMLMEMLWESVEEVQRKLCELPCGMETFTPAFFNRECAVTHQESTCPT